MTYACHNRTPFAPSIQVADGWENNCFYSTSDLGQKDKGCDGCVWKARAGASVPSTNVHMGDSVDGIRPVEGQPLGDERPGDVERASPTAEQRAAEPQARSAESLEAIYPGAAMYRPIQPTEEK